MLAPPASPPQTQATRVSETALLNNNNAQVADALAESNYKLADPIVRIVSLQQRFGESSTSHPHGKYGDAKREVCALNSKEYAIVSWSENGSE